MARAGEGTLRSRFALSYILIMISNGLNFLFQIVMGRFFTVAEFGLGNSFISIITNLSIVFLPFTVIMCREVVTTKEDEKNRSRIFWELVRASLWVALGLEAVCAAAGLFGAGGFSAGAWLSMGCAAVSYAAFLLVQSFFQGIEDFGRHGLIGILFFGLKIGLFIVLCLLGFAGAAVTGSLFLSGIIAVLAGVLWIREGHLVTREKPVRGLAAFRSSYGATFVLQLLYSLYINGGDILLVKARFGDETTGLYSSVTIIGKVLVFLVLALSGVLLPEVTRRRSEGEQTRGLILRLAGLCVLFALCYSGAIAWFGYRLIPVVLGERYRIGREMVLPTMLFYGAACVMGLFYNYMLAIGKTTVMIAFLGGSLALTLLFAGFMPTLPATLVWMGGVLAAAMALCLVYIIRENGMGKQNAEDD